MLLRCTFGLGKVGPCDTELRPLYPRPGAWAATQGRSEEWSQAMEHSLSLQRSPRVSTHLGLKLSVTTWSSTWSHLYASQCWRNLALTYWAFWFVSWENVMLERPSYGHLSHQMKQSQRVGARRHQPSSRQNFQNNRVWVSFVHKWQSDYSKERTIATLTWTKDM